MTKMTTALRGVDQKMRSASTCPNCGKPREGLLFTYGGRMRGTGRHGESHYTGYKTETREQTGMCQCVRVTFEMDGENEAEVFPDRAAMKASVEDILRGMGWDMKTVPQGWERSPGFQILRGGTLCATVRVSDVWSEKAQEVNRGR